MKIARLGAASAAAGIVVLCAAGPAFATGASPAPSAGLNQAPQSSTAPGTGPTADVTPKTFFGGDTLTFTVKNCSVHPTITDVNHLFVRDNPFVKTVGNDYAAKEVARKDLVHGKVYTVIVKCGDWTDTFTTKPRKRPSPTPGTPSIPPTTQPTGMPSGAPQTGDGSSNGGGNTGLMAAGAGVVLAGLAGGGYLVARRRSSTGA